MRQDADDKTNDTVFLICMRKALKHLLNNAGMKGMGVQTEDHGTFILHFHNESIIIIKQSEHESRVVSDSAVMQNIDSEDAEIVKSITTVILNKFIKPDHGIVVLHEGEKFSIGSKNDGGAIILQIPKYLPEYDDLHEFTLIKLCDSDEEKLAAREFRLHEAPRTLH